MGGPLDESLPPLGPPQVSKARPRVIAQPRRYRWRVIRDLALDESTLEVIKDEGVAHHVDIDLHVQRNATEWYTYRTADYGSVRGEVISERGFRRGDWSVRSRTRTVLASDAECFEFWAELDAYEDDRRVVARSWHQRIPRDHM